MKKLFLKNKRKNEKVKSNLNQQTLKCSEKLFRKPLMVKLLLFGFSLITAQISSAQKELEYRNRIGVSFFKLESNSETMNNELESKFVYGIYYERTLTRKITLFNSAEFGKNTFYDNCRNCADHYTGNGEMTEFNLSTGVKYIFNWRSQSRIKFFAEGDIYYSNIRYSGHFSGGFTGSSIDRDFTNHVVGGLGRAGINFYPHSRFVFTISSSYRFGKAWQHNYLGSNIWLNQSAAVTPLEFRIGFLF